MPTTNEPGFKISVDGVDHVVRQSDMTGIDSRDFYQATGVTWSAVLADRNLLDLFTIAGLVWICRRRRERSLTFEQVAGAMTYNTQLAVELDSGDPVVDEADPEA